MGVSCAQLVSEEITSVIEKMGLLPNFLITFELAFIYSAALSKK